ncbi:Vacuolar protein sorting-associated protein 13 [Dioscorea alata]|uniref:Vacuolar protein sorting-associated protein 13 n=1 Tax=Dioscorea alata TaxID=55571 RepID=A0ACB7VHM9_DIOAL|nr:Vacuolar protein sorting-associated protein 13 [Dioscorea alata]
MFKFISMYVKAKSLSGTKRDLGKTVRTAGSNAMFAALTEISDNVLSGAETNGLNGMVTGFHQGIFRLAMEPTLLLGAALMEGGSDRKIELVCGPRDDEQRRYIEGYLQAMLDTRYQIQCLRVSVAEDQVCLKNLPANTSIINEIMENVKAVLVSKKLLQTENEWSVWPTVRTLCEHLFVHYTIHKLHEEASKFLVGIRSKTKKDGDKVEPSKEGRKKHAWTRAFGKFVLSSMFAYVNGWLCRHLPSPIVRRIASSFLLSFLDKNSST